MSARSKKECVVLIASPAVEVRRRLKDSLNNLFSVHQASDRAGALRMLTKLKPSVLFLDLALAGDEGLHIIPVICKLSKTTKTVVLGDKGGEGEEITALEAGAKGYCHRDIDPVLARKAVRALQKREIWVERRIIPSLVKELQECKRQPVQNTHTDQEPVDGLTIRQYQIASLISNGASNKEIAKELRITEATVKAHVHTIFRKLGISDRLGLALFVRDTLRAS